LFRPPGLFFKNLQPISVGAGALGYLVEAGSAGNGNAGGLRETFKKFWCSYDAKCLVPVRSG